MSGTLDDRYFEWLYHKIGAVRNRNPSRSHWRLAKQLYTTPFEWTVPNDDNRMEDGCDLRYEFLDEEDIHDADPAWMGLQCSMLEMLIGLAERASFESYGAPGDWFWKLLQNVDLKGYTDAVYSTAIEREVGRTLERINHRKYNADGTGGLFPLSNPNEDQRQVELWYQLSAYLLEGGYLDHGPQI